MRNGIAGAVIAAVALCGTAQAIETLEPIRLPDGGLGSDALGVLSGDPDGALVVAGWSNDASRHEQPTLWTFTPAGQFLSSETLSLLPFMEQGNVVGGRRFANGDVVALGVNSDTASPPLRHAVIWRKPNGGAWGSPERLSSSAESDVSRVDAPDGVAEFVFVAGTVTSGSTDRPVLHRIDETSVTTTELPAPGDAEGAAIGLLSSKGTGEVLAVCGWTRGSDFLRSPCVWRRAGDAFVHVPVPLPRGSSGQISSLSDAGDGTLRLAGELTTPKRITRGFVLDFIGGSDDGTGIRRRAPLPPISSYLNSFPSEFVGGATEGTGIRMAAPVVGTSRDAAGNVLHTIWARSSRGAWEPFAVLDILEASLPLRSFRCSGAAFIGQAFDWDAAPQGVVFRPTRLHVPDGIELTRSRRPAAEPFYLEVLRNSGTALYLASRGSRDARYANIEVSYVVPPQGTTTLALEYGVRASTSIGSGTLVVKVLEPLTGNSRTIGTHGLSRTLETFTGSFSGEFAELVDANDALLRISLEFTSIGGVKERFLLGRTSVSGFDGLR